jgi:hypothetical protein
MNKLAAATAFRVLSIALALLAGLGEFTTLQRWRLREWMTR